MLLTTFKTKLIFSYSSCAFFLNCISDQLITMAITLALSALQLAVSPGSLQGEVPLSSFPHLSLDVGLLSTWTAAADSSQCCLALE